MRTPQETVDHARQAKDPVNPSLSKGDKERLLNLIREGRETDAERLLNEWAHREIRYLADILGLSIRL
jgi:hypothetical protein